MSNEKQTADTIEMLYKRLNEYHKQDLFNYGYLLESNQILCKDIEEKDKFKLRCYKALKLIRDNYGLLDKYGIDMIDDILNGGDDKDGND